MAFPLPEIRLATNVYVIVVFVFLRAKIQYFFDIYKY